MVAAMSPAARRNSLVGFVTAVWSFSILLERFLSNLNNNYCCLHFQLVDVLAGAAVYSGKFGDLGAVTAITSGEFQAVLEIAFASATHVVVIADREYTLQIAVSADYVLEFDHLQSTSKDTVIPLGLVLTLLTASVVVLLGVLWLVNSRRNRRQNDLALTAARKTHNVIVGALGHSFLFLTSRICVTWCFGWLAGLLAGRLAGWLVGCASRGQRTSNKCKQGPA